MPALDVNTLIYASLVVGALYGLIAGKFHLRLFVLSIYVGLVLAERLTSFAKPYLPSLATDQVSWLLLGVPIVIFSFVPRGKHGGQGDRGSSIINMIVGLLAGAFVASTALNVLPTSQLAAIGQESYFALELQRFHLWLLGLLPIAVLLITFHRPKGKGGHH